MRHGLLLLFMLSLLLLACEQKQEPEQVAGQLHADQTYRQYFGTPPTPRAGTAWVRVGFLPRSDGSGKLAPLPFFFYRESGQLQLLLDQLTGDNLRLPEESGLRNPFPPGTRAVTANRVAGTREINLELPPGAQADRESMAAVLVETAGRFSAIKKVRLTLRGEPWPGMPDAGFEVPTGRTVEPGPPHPLLALADFGPDADHPAELLVNFNRPLKLESFRLESVDGQEVAGDYFQSVFEMAVVVHPKHPEQLQVGKPVRISWQATDFKGRTGEGTVEMELRGRAGH